MEILGRIGNFYIVLLVFFLIGGTWIMGNNFAKKIWQNTENLIDKKGGKWMNNWLKLAVTAFVGIFVASFALGLTGTGGSQDNGMGTMGAMSNTDTTGQVNHAAHHTGSQTGQDSMLTGNMQGVSGMYSNVDASAMSNMNGQMSNMNGQMNNQMQATGQNYYDYRLNQLQWNMMQLQQQLNQFMQMQSGQMNNMNNSGNMSNMNSNMSNGSMNGQGSSGGGMSMM